MKVENLINVERFPDAAWLLLSVINKVVKTVSSSYNPRGNRYNLSFFKGVVLTTRFVHERGRKRTIRIKLTLGICVCVVANEDLPQRVHDARFQFFREAVAQPASCFGKCGSGRVSFPVIRVYQ